MSLVSFMSEPMSAEQSSLMFNPLSNIVRSIIADANGAMLDPSDMTTMFQDAAGTTPVTAVEQPVGLMLDKSRGMMLGPELVTNGDFSNGLSGWVAESGWSVSGGVAISEGSSFKALYQNSLVLGKTYRISFTILNYVSGSVKALAGYSSAYSPSFNAAGTFTVTLRCSGDTVLYLQSYLFVGSIDNISVRELKGNHATQSITASRPTLSARKNIMLATETLATQSVTTLAAQYTLSFTGTGSVTLSGTATGTLTGTGTDRVSLTFTPTAGTLTLTVSGSVTKAQCELGAVTGTYQRVNTSTDYDTDERYFPKYLRFDGVDDYLNLPYMGLYAGGKMSIIAALDAVSQSTDTYIISERSTTDIDHKYFPLRQLANGGNMDAYIADDAGAVVLDTVGSAFGGAADKVIRSIVDTGSNLKLFKNGSVAASDNYTRAGTLTLNTTTIGSSVSTTTSNYAKMKLYGLLITKSAMSDAQRIQCERYAASKSGVQL